MKKHKLVLLTLVSLAVTPSLMAFDKGDFIVRAGLANVSPDDASSNVIVGNDLGFGLAVDRDTQLGLNFAYFLTDQLNIEVLASTPFTHDVNFAVADPLGTGNQLGEVSHLPPTVTLNYYFNDSASPFQPYIGAGLNYTIFFEDKFTGANGNAGLNDLSLDNSWGVAATVGLDYMVNDKWFVNGSIRWIDIDTEADFNLNGTSGRVEDIEIDPYVYTLSIGYLF